MAVFSFMLMLLALATSERKWYSGLKWKQITKKKFDTEIQDCLGKTTFSWAMFDFTILIFSLENQVLIFHIQDGLTITLSEAQTLPRGH